MPTRRQLLKGAAGSAFFLLAAELPLGGAALASTERALAAQAAQGSPFAQSLASRYVDPARVFSSDVRWWLGDASHTDETLLEEIQALYDAGFRGVELAMQNDAVAPDALYAYGSAMWTHKWNLVMNELLDLGMSVYLTSGTHWSTSNVPGLDPTSQEAMQALVMGTATVAAGAALTALPTPPTNAQRPAARFVTAYAYRVVSGDTVDPDSFVDLAPRVTQGADAWTQDLTWTAPADGTYRVFAMWTQGTFQTSSPATQPSYATNYFDERGVAALRRFWEANYLSDPALRAKIAAGDVQLFMDSLEYHPGGGPEFGNAVRQAAQFTTWSEDMAAEFRRRKGYDITPWLFLVRGVKAFVSNPYHSVETTGVYRLDGEEQRRQGIVNDWLDVQTQLYRERMLRPLKAWLNSVGIETRVQISYGVAVEMSEPIMDVDFPEAENFNQYNQVDIFRLWTGGSKLENKVLSTETGAQVPPFGATRQLDLKDAYSAYAAGFQRHVWHIWGAGFGYGSFQWPGFTASAAFRYFGTRHPGARHYDEFNAHLGRVQQLMQTGRSRTDVGFVHQIWAHGVRFGGGIGSDNTAMNWQLAHQGVYYRSTELQDHGYTYDYFSPRFLFDDDVSFDESTHTIEQAGYKAIVIYQDWLELASAKRILEWARKGLKVVVLGAAASRTPFEDDGDAELAQVMAALEALPTVRTATVADMPAGGYFSSAPGGYSDDVLDKLQELGVQPYTGYAEPSLQLLTQTRQDADGHRYVFVYNYDDGSYRDRSLRPEIRNAPAPGRTASAELEVEGRFVPYRIDAWTGEVTELAEFRWEDGKTVVPVEVPYNDIALLAFERAADAGLHIVETNAESAEATDEGVLVRATASGTLTTELSNGRRYVSRVTVPAAYDITGWDLTVQSWRPNPVAGDLVRTETIGGLTTVNRKTSTVVTPIAVRLNTLTTWDQIPQIGRAVSGTGRYEATFTWDADRADGAYLDFGHTLHESMEVWINGRKVGGRVSTHPSKVRRDVGGVGKTTVDDGTGRQVPLVGQELWTGGINWITPVADVSELLVHGQNRIVIEYSSVLSNVQLDRGVITVNQHSRGWWNNPSDYLPFGPAQAKIVPFVQKEYRESWVSALTDVDELLERFSADGTISDRTTATLRDRLDRAIGAAQAGREAPAMAFLRQFIDRTRNQVKGDAADVAARDALVDAAQFALEGLQGLDDSEG